MRLWLLRHQRAVPVAIFLAIAAVTIVSVVAIERNARQTERLQLGGVAQTIASALDRRGNAYAAYLRAGAAFIARSGEFEPRGFSQFVSELRLDSDYRSAEGIGWAPVVDPGPDAELAAPVAYFYPDTTRNRRAIGYDPFSESVRNAAMKEALRTVRPTASGKVVLPQEGFDDAPGFVIFMPVFDTANAPSPLKGFVYSPFNAGQFVSKALEPLAVEEVKIKLYDGEQLPGNELAKLNDEFAGSLAVEREVLIAHRPFTLVVQARPEGKLAPLSMVTLLFGLAVALLLMMLARLVTRQAKEDQERIDFFEEQNSIRNSLTRELNHRVKNTLANVLSILALTRRRTDNLDEFADGLEGRIRSLSATHDLLTQSDWGTTPMRAVIEAELSHFREARDHSVVLNGPQVELAPNDALSFGLAIHELATNAAKFGALSNEGGEVYVSWRLAEDKTNLAEIEWRELKGPPVSASRRRGFGTDLIEKVVAHELRHPVQLEFKAEGVRCVFLVPIRRRSDFKVRERS
ncbi:MAG: CHASE domain-containing protein [Pseudomonadota bacterium]